MSSGRPVSKLLISSSHAVVKKHHLYGYMTKFQVTVFLVLFGCSGLFFVIGVPILYWGHRTLGAAESGHPCTKKSPGLVELPEKQNVRVATGKS